MNEWVTEMRRRARERADDRNKKLKRRQKPSTPKPPKFEWMRSFLESGQHGRITQNEARVLSVYFDYADVETMEFRPSLGTVCREAGIGNRTRVSEAIHRLEWRGYIETVSEGGGGRTCAVRRLANPTPSERKTFLERKERERKKRRWKKLDEAAGRVKDEHAKMRGRRADARRRDAGARKGRRADARFSDSGHRHPNNHWE